jgi:F-type H+-transporting ATPase subunit b
VNINLTLVVQMVVFAILIWGTMKWIWPKILKAMDERQAKIAAGLAAAEKGEKSLTEAKERADAIIREARERARQIDEQASRRSNEAIEAAKGVAVNEGARIVASARTEAATEVSRARDALRKEFGAAVVAGASRLLEREVDASAHAQLLDKLAEEIGRS